MNNLSINDLSISVHPKIRPLLKEVLRHRVLSDALIECGHPDPYHSKRSKRPEPKEWDSKKEINKALKEYQKIPNDKSNPTNCPHCLSGLFEWSDGTKNCWECGWSEQKKSLFKIFINWLKG